MEISQSEVEGRGGMNSDEVSVDLSSDGNYERIESWLEEYVHTNSKSNKSQSSLFQMFSGGLKRSASDWKVNNSLKNSRTNNNNFIDKQNLDVHKYLTKLYNANDKTLLLKKHSASTINLITTGRNDSFSSKDEAKQIERRLSLGSKKSEGSCNGEPETITIKLNPTIVQTEAEEGPSDKKMSTKQQAGKQSSSEESESDSEDSSKKSHQISSAIKADIELFKTDIGKLSLEKNYFNEAAITSGNESESSRSKELSRSESQVSSESFESVHSSVNDNDHDHFEKVKSKLNRNSISLKSDNEGKIEQTEAFEPNSSREPSSEKDFYHYENIDILREQQKEQNISLDFGDGTHYSKWQKTVKSLTNEVIWNRNNEVEEEGHENMNFGNSSKSPQNEHSLIKELIERPNSSVSTNDSNDKYEEVTSDEDMPLVENESAGLFNTSNVQLRIVPETEDEIDDLSENSYLSSNRRHNDKSKIPVKVKKSNQRLENISDKSSNLIQTKRKIQTKRDRQYYASVKSDSDINDDRSMDFSEESFDYNEMGEKGSPVKTKKSVSLRLSEANSDRDVSSIPTDSEKELVYEQKKNEHIQLNAINNISTDLKSQFQPHHAELLDLLKKSLTNDNVIEKLVSTLFASVIQASVEGKVLKEPEVHIGLKEGTQREEEHTQKNSEKDKIEVVNNIVESEHIETSEILTDGKNNLKELETLPPEENAESGIITKPLELHTNELDLQNESPHIFIQQEINENDSPFYSNVYAEGIIVNQENNGITHLNLEQSAPNVPGEILEHNSMNEQSQEGKIESVIYTLENNHSELATYVEKNDDKISNTAEINDSSETHKDKKADEDLMNHQNKSPVQEANQQEDIKIVSSILTLTQPINEIESINHSHDKRASEVLTSHLDKNIALNIANFQNNMTEIITDNSFKEEAAINAEGESYGITVNRSQSTGDIEMQHKNNLQDTANKVKSLKETQREEQSSDINLDIFKEKTSSQEKSYADENVNQNSAHDGGESPFNIASRITKEVTVEHTVNYLDSSSEELPAANIDVANTSEGSASAITATLTVKNKTDNEVNIVIRTAQNEIKKTPAKFTRKKKIKLSDKSDSTNKLEKIVSQKSLSNLELQQISSIPQTLNSTENKEFSISESSLIDDQETFLQKAEEGSLVLADSGQQNSFEPEREARRLLAEGLVDTYQQAELVIQLRELHIDDEATIMTAAKECSSLEAALAYLQQECQLCAGKYAIKQMVSMLECEHICCVECACNYFTLQITERSINDCVCPFCKEPDILHVEEDKALTYFSNLDIFLKGIVKENIHELFQRKLRDRTLMQDPNFKWCVKCSSGFIANPRQKRLMCPDCKAITCAKCMKPWEKEHDKMSCDEYKAWMDQNDPENQLVKHLEENGVTCPNCKSKYILAKGGCMHLTCPQCKHEFCSGCTKPFRMGRKCPVSDYCEKLGLHAHHPRNCLFYLRDKEPEELERLLEENNIDFNRVVENDSSKRCGIQMLKETPDGMVEGICGYPIIKAGLCRAHYIESLVVRIRQSKIDPVKLLDFNEAIQELTRHGKTLPVRPQSMSEFNYRQILYKVIEEEIPLD